MNACIIIIIIMYVCLYVLIHVFNIYLTFYSHQPEGNDWKSV